VSEVLVVIPARYDSRRLPGKALADVSGRPLVVRVAETAAKMKTAGRVIVATDDARIAEAVQEAGFACEMTGAHPTGTDRVGEVVARYDCDIVVNLQGDEPLLDPQDADRMVAALESDAAAGIATCAHPFKDEESWRDANVVKVLVDRAGHAVYFSRAPVPAGAPDGAPAPSWRHALRHVGIYAFRREALARFLSLPRGQLERAEGLEQLRALENGMTIRVLSITTEPVGVDTPADLAAVRRLWAQRTAE
jgi:3-deoxy-manno-octulosonate cytidylyltransferase (CMP-KDO synthetase)